MTKGAGDTHPEDALPVDFADAWLSPSEAVLYLESIGVPRTRGTLAKWRCVGGRGPPFRLDAGKPRYWRRALHLWAMAELSRPRASPTRGPDAMRPRTG